MQKRKQTVHNTEMSLSRKVQNIKFTIQMAKNIT